MTGIILFRAQPFHNGHLEQIKRAFREMRDLDEDLYVIVGSADKFGTKRNPIPIDVRMDLITGTLEEELEEWSYEQRQHLKVVPLDDLSDEANNTHSWGHYLYDSLCEITDDNEFVFYYSDKPEIVLSWFPDFRRDDIWFRFLSRVDDICATDVRKCLSNLTKANCALLGEYLPFYVFTKIHELHEYIVNAR